MNPRRPRTILFASGILLFTVHCGGDNTPEDLEAPIPTSSTISQDFAGPGQTITIRLSVGEELTSSPTVTLDTTPPRSLNFLEFASDIYEYDYTVTGDEPEGFVSVLATMTDLAGNTTTNIAIGSITFDFTAPVVNNVGTFQFLRAGVRGVISFSSDDVVRQDSTARFVNSGTLDGVTLEYQHSALVFTGFAYTSTGSEAEGVVTHVEFTVEDIAGNRTVSGPHDAFIFDFTAPGFDVMPLVTSPSVSISGEETVEVTFTANEPLKAVRVEMTPQSNGSIVTLFETADATDSVWTASVKLSVAGPFSAEVWNLEGSLTDMAGNRTVTDLGTVTLVN